MIVQRMPELIRRAHTLGLKTGLFLNPRREGEVRVQRKKPDLRLLKAQQYPLFQPASTQPEIGTPRGSQNVEMPELQRPAQPFTFVIAQSVPHRNLLGFVQPHYHILIGSQTLRILRSNTDAIENTEVVKRLLRLQHLSQTKRVTLVET